MKDLALATIMCLDLADQIIATKAEVKVYKDGMRYDWENFQHRFADSEPDGHWYLFAEKKLGTLEPALAKLEEAYVDMSTRCKNLAHKK